MSGTAASGRRPKPPALHVISGRSPGRDSGGRKVKELARFVRTAPNPPSWLDREAKAEWARRVPELARMKLLKQADRASLSAYCSMWSLFVTATKDVQRNGLTVENHSVKKDGTESTWTTVNPAVRVQLQAQAALRQWCAEYGMTPSAEGRLNVGKATDGEEEDGILD